ncbi:MAG: D-glycero-beta-D-manno-heptose 1,7-bisphosphate 7-phosphatase [Gammaproteobacteria bacterium]|nr:D-glycero-beta-D-manno-heptose 1,7-bisphosphate 7-phosphatase [Gammaproteobacteria bacterium]
MKLVILDRDGVINEDSPDYIKSVAEWKPIPGSLEAIARLCHAGYRVFVASNQSAIGRGYMDYDALFAIHDRMQRSVAELGGRIDAIAFAPDHPDQASAKRKPKPGMLLDIARRMGVSLDKVPVVGDSFRDIEAARAAKARPVLVRTGNGAETERKHGADLAGVEVYDSLAAFAAALVAAG